MPGQSDGSDSNGSNVNLHCESAFIFVNVKQTSKAHFKAVK